MFTGSMSATTSRITSSIKSRTASASFDTLPVRTTKVGAIPNYIKQRKQEINSENSKTPSRSSSRPSTASEIIPEKKLKLGAIPSYLKKDHVPNLSGEFKMKLEKYETLKNNLAHIKQKLKVAFMDCKKISENSGGKITFEDSLKEDALSTSKDSRTFSHPVAAIARNQVEDIKQEYLKSAQKFLEEFKSQIHEV